MLDRIRRSTTLRGFARSIHPSNLRRAALDRLFPYTFTSCEEAFGKGCVRGASFCEGQTITSAPPDPRDDSATLSIPERSCLFVHGGDVWPAHSMVSNHRGLVPIESGFDLERMKATRRSGTMSHYRIHESDADAVVAIECGAWWMNYYHSLIEAIPRVWALHFGECRSIGRIEVLVSRLATPGWMAILEAMLPPNAALRAVPVESRIRCGTTIVSPCLSLFEAGALPAAYLGFFRARMAAHFGPSTTRRPERIYISRSRAAMRRVENESEVMSMLEARGFRWVDLDGMPHSEQFSIFSRAAVVVGPHGAGFTNIIHSPPGCVVLDVFPSTPIPYFRWLSASCGHRYSWMRGEYPDKNVERFHVDVGALARRIDELDG